MQMKCQERENCNDCSGNNRIQFWSRGTGPSEEKPGEYTEQARSDSRDCAEVTFRVEESIVFLSRQVLKIEMIADVITFPELPGHPVRSRVKQLFRFGPGGAIPDGGGVGTVQQQVGSSRVAVLLSEVRDV